MTISPGSDLILDALRAAEPRQANKAAYALEKLSSRTYIEPASRTTPTRSAATTDIQEKKAYREFEALLLKDAFTNMLPQEAQSVYGKGAAGGFWKAWMAEAVSNQIAEAGGIGVADLLAANLNRKQPAILSAVAQNDNAPEGERPVSVSTAETAVSESPQVPREPISLLLRLQHTLAGILNSQEHGIDTAAVADRDEKYKWVK